MSKHADAKIEGNSLYLNGGWKIFISLIVIFTSAVTAYAFYEKFPTMEERLHKLEERFHKIDVIDVKVDIMQRDISEFKTLLRRSSPYELRDQH